MLEYDTENMNSDEIYSSLRGVTEAIQSFSYRSQEDLNELRGKRDDAVSPNLFIGSVLSPRSLSKRIGGYIQSPTPFTSSSNEF